MVRVHVHHGVAQRAADARRADGAERRAVLDEPPLAAAVPDEVRDLVDVGERTRCERREADRASATGRRTPPCRSARARAARRASAPSLARRQPRASTGVSPSTTTTISFLALIGDGALLGERAQTRVALGRAPPDPQPEQRHDDCLDVADGAGTSASAARTSPATPTSAAVPASVPPRRSAPRTTCEAPSIPERSADAAADRAAARHRRRSRAQPRSRAAATPPTRIPASVRARAPGSDHAAADGEAENQTDRVPRAHRARSVVPRSYGAALEPGDHVEAERRRSSTVYDPVVEGDRDVAISRTTISPSRTTARGAIRWMPRIADLGMVDRAASRPARRASRRS